MRRPSINEYFSAMALVVSTRATCPRRKVGCIIIDEQNLVMATGYNGVPKGMAHCTDEVPCGGQSDNSDSGYDSCSAIHAEQNALMQCSDVQKIKEIYITTSPCITCAKMIANTSCKTVYYSEKHRKTAGIDYLSKVGIECVYYELPIELRVR